MIFMTRKNGVRAISAHINFLLLVLCFCFVSLPTLSVAQVDKSSSFGMCDVDGAPIVKKKGKELYYCGVISSTGKRHLAPLVSESVESLYIESAGGSALAALEISNLLNQHEIKVVFQGVCASACIFIAIDANYIEIRKYGIFVAHSSVSEKIRLIFNVRKNLHPLDDFSDAFSYVEYIDQNSEGGWSAPQKVVHYLS